jgi:Tat protein secretion system quality control protein TatD with DNase activity
MYSATFGGRAGRSKKSGPKSKKVKCLLCGAKGHDGDACPKKGDLKPTAGAVGGAGSGITHKTSRRAKKEATEDDDVVEDHVLAALDDNNNNNPYFVFDAGCDVGASVDSLAVLLKAPEKKCVATYNASVSSPIYGGAICRQYIKASKPWKSSAPRVTMMLEADPNLFFVVGLGSGFLERDDEDDDYAVEALVGAIGGDARVVGVCAKLDYAPDMVARTDVDTQLRRLRTTCEVAMQEQVPIQIRVGTVDTEELQVKAMKDLAQVLLNMTEHPLQVHLSCWSGTSATMLKLLKAFPDTVYFGMNPAVGFAKAAAAHECAFDVPLNRLLLETDNVIPAPVTKSMGRKAFSHSGLVSYCAAAVAEQKKIQPGEVARAASENTVRLYGKGIAERAKEAIVEAEARIAQQRLEEQEEDEAAGFDNTMEEEHIETKQALKKKKKKKKGTGEQKDTIADAEDDFDDGILSTMLVDSAI